MLAKAIQVHEHVSLKNEVGMQDGMYGEAFLMGSVSADAGGKWHTDLMSAWETNLPSKMEEAIAVNIEELETH